MTRQRVPFSALAVVALAVVQLASGCTGADRDGGAIRTPPVAGSPAATPAPAATQEPAATQGATLTPAASAGTPATPASGYRVTYGWAVPSRPVRVAHVVRVPVAPPPAPPLPLLTEVRAGDHPGEGYSRVTFAFRGATPSYEVAYTRRVEAEGSGEPLPLTGNAFLRIRFDQAQAHDEQGRASVPTAARTQLSYPTLRSYGFGGDFEGYVTFGLGLQVAAGSDQVLPVRVGELVRADGSHVVAVDVRRV